MKLFAFTKKGIVYIGAISVVLAAYVSAVIMNYASEKITGEHLLATLLFQLIFALFEFLTVYKKLTPLRKVSRVVCIASAAVCIACAVLSALKVEFMGSPGFLMGYVVIFFIAPFYGAGFVINSELWVCIYGLASGIIGLLLPSVFEKSIKHKKLTKKYR